MAAMITRAWLNWNAHCVQLSLVRNPMKDHAGNATKHRSDRVRAYAGHGLTMRGTVEVAPIWWVFVSAVGALMPFMLATRPTSALAGSAPGQVSTSTQATGSSHTTAIHKPTTHNPHEPTHKGRGPRRHTVCAAPGSSSNDAAQSLTA